MKTSTKRILSIGLAALFFVGTLIVYASFIRPEMDTISQKRALTLSKDNLFNNQKTAVQGVQKLIAQFQSIVALQEQVSLAMPLGPNTTQALNQIEAVATISQARLNSLSVKTEALLPSRQPLAKRLGTLNVNLGITGSYENIKVFLRGLETNVRVANVKSFVISPVGSTQDLYTITLSVEIYYQEKN